MGFFGWRYADPNFERVAGVARPVITSNGQLFPSVAAAARGCGISPTVICRACRDQKTAGGVEWRFVKFEK